MKKYEHYKVEDFLQDDLFVQWCYSGSPELTEYWQRWCEQYAEKVPVLQKAREIVQSVEYKEQERASEEVYQRILQQVLQESEKKEIEEYQKVYRQGYWKVAAVLFMLIAAAVYFLGRQQSQPAGVYSPAVTYVEKYCPAGRKMSIILDDGTKVKLNGDTYLRYAENFGDNLREVELTGEAFFEVAKDTKRPFVVRCQHLQTTVLGTSFNMQAYPDSKETDVAVVEGLVQVAVSAQSKSLDSALVFLAKGERVNYKASEDQWKKEAVQVASIGRWRNWELVFKQDDMIDIARKLERWYGVKAIVKGPFSRKIHYSATYHNNTLYAVLEGISYSTKISYTLKGDTVYIEPLHL